MFRKNVDPLHLKMCNICSKRLTVRTVSVVVKGFLKPPKITKIYCSTVGVWLNNLFSLGHVSLLLFSKAESQFMSCRTALSALYLIQNQTISKAVNSTHLPDISSSSSY